MLLQHRVLQIQIRNVAAQKQIVCLSGIDRQAGNMAQLMIKALPFLRQPLPGFLLVGAILENDLPRQGGKSIYRPRHLALAHSCHRPRIAIDQIPQAQAGYGIKFGERTQHPHVRIVGQKRNKSWLIGDKIDKRLIEDQGDVQRLTAFSNQRQQSTIGQQAGWIVRRAEK